METEEVTLKKIIARFESQFPSLTEQIRLITDQRLGILLSMGIAGQKASSGNTTTQLE